MKELTRTSFKKTATVKKIILAAVCTVLLLTLALLEYYLPLKTLLPAIKIPPLAEGEMRVHFLDVGEGDCTVIESSDGVIIVDAGDGSFKTENRLIRYLKGLNARSYTMIATHADLDHFGGFAQLIRTFGADGVYLPPLSSETGEYQQFLSAVNESGCEVKTLMRYVVIPFGAGSYAACISPDSSAGTDGNDRSAVLFVHCGGVNFLLGADISSTHEERLLSEYALMEGIFDCGESRVRLEETDILKVSHHGSDSSSGSGWLSLLRPSAAVVTCGKGNSYSHPSQGAIARLSEAGAEIYRTDELGSIVVRIRDGNYSISA